MLTAALVRKLEAAKEAYYAGEPTMSDADFDALEEELKGLDPKNKYFKKVGVPTGNSKSKVKHDFPMLSCGKAKNHLEAMAWAGKIGASAEMFIVQPKIDGLSCACVYENGKLMMVKTRGDGTVGQNISHIAAYVNIPKAIDIKEKVEVRGELYLPKNTKYPNPDNKPLRNIAVGLVNRKETGLEDLKHVHFIAYQVHENFKASMTRPGAFNLETYKMSWLDVQGFERVWYDLIGMNAFKNIYDRYLSELRKAWLYETDGLVLTVNDNGLWKSINRQYEVSHHNHYNIALKPPSEGKETELLDIEWNVSRQGKLIPVAIVKPVELGGATVQRCTLNNFDNVDKLKLHKGDRVLIERANDVIPFFKENLDAGQINKQYPIGRPGASVDILPKACPSCHGPLEIQEDGVHIVCLNQVCVEMVIQQITHWVKACQMEGVAEATIRTLVVDGVLSSIKDLYSLTEKKLRGLEGFGDTRISNVLSEIGRTREMTIGQFIDRLGIELVGEKAMAKLGIKTMEDLWAFKDDTYVIGCNLMDYLKENKSYVKALLECVKIIKPKEASAGAKKVCMTGSGPKGRKELMADIESKGDVFVESVSKDTDILICEDINGASSKLEKARKMGVKLVAYKEYFK